VTIPGGSGQVQSVLMASPDSRRALMMPAAWVWTGWVPPLAVAYCCSQTVGSGDPAAMLAARSTSL
jgi:hypothetical protein